VSSAPAAADGPTVLVATTHPLTAHRLMRGQLADLRRRGWRPTLLSSPGPLLDAVGRREGVPVLGIPMRREIHPWADLSALVRVRSAVARLGPALINSGTPKAGLLVMAAAASLRHPRRIYTLRGLRLETAEGARRTLLTAAERLSCRLAHHVVCVSRSLRDRAVVLGVASPSKLHVLADGSSNGVDVERFAPAGAQRRREARARFGVPERGPVIGFLGRLTRDKGIADLVRAFDRVHVSYPDAILLLAGDFEAGDPVRADIRQRVHCEPHFVLTGFVEEAAELYAALDLLAFPSYREGFPNAPLEAAACGVPTVGYAATGTVDAVADGETGTLVPIGDAEALAAAILDHLDHPDMRASRGAAARRRAVERFRRERLWEEWDNLYRRLLSERRG
jgi:glycosyltransferase involved in cell wall biosynthesis